MSVYTGEAKFIGQYFYGEENDNAPDFVIPDYQREYSWGKENIDQLFVDIQSGVKHLSCNDLPEIKKGEKSKFLGCIIQWIRKAKEDEDYYPSNSKYIAELRELIDGQQRTSTLLVLFVRFYYYFENATLALENNPTEMLLKKYIKREIQKKWLLKRFSKNIPSVSKNRPVLIRQDSDRWSEHSRTAIYISPVTQYLNDAIVAIDTASASTKLNHISTENTNLAVVTKAIDESIATIFDSEDYFSLGSAYNLEDLFSEYFIEDSNEEGVDLVSYLSTNDARSVVLKPIINNMAFLHYLLNYCAFTVISSPTENAALDMFQSLNSTGVQLTALQMLKPQISSQYKKLSLSYVNSITNKNYNYINDWFNSDLKNRDRKTKQFFLKFCMLMSAESDPSSLSLQRTWLKVSYDDFIRKQKKTERTDEFVSIIRSLVDYLDRFVIKKNKLRECVNGKYQNYIIKNENSNIDDVLLSDECITYLMYLSDAGHEVHHALLIRFYHQARTANCKNTFESAVNDFQQVVGAVTSIFSLYRIGLDKHPDGFYKKLFAKCFSLIILSNENLNAQKIIAKLRIEFYREVKGKIDAPKLFDSFVDSFSSNCRYNKQSSAVLKFILILNTHMKVSLESKPGLLKEDITGPIYLTPNVWVDENLQSIEHICPQSAEKVDNIDYWGSKFLSSTKIHSIGNLTLLKSDNNASIGETSQSKLNGYKNLTTAGALHLAQPKVTNNAINTTMQYHLKPIVERLDLWVSSETGEEIDHSFAWSPNFVEERSINISKLAIISLVKGLNI